MPKLSVRGLIVLAAEGDAPKRVPNVQEAANQVRYAIWANLKYVSALDPVINSVTYRVIAIAAQEVESSAQTRACRWEYGNGRTAPGNTQPKGNVGHFGNPTELGLRHIEAAKHPCQSSGSGQ